MTLQARVIGPASELGQFESLDFFGQSLTREFADVTFTTEQVKILEDNRYVELKGKPDNQTEAEEKEDRRDDAEREVISARLVELGEKVDGRMSIGTLRSKLATAERAQAEREDAAERKAAEAQEAAEAAALAND